MATVQIKSDYAASEVYSTASEPPPAYKRQSSSVQIARIVAFTVIISSFIIGAFILASAYLQARASCDQMQALDSVLEKELMLETLQQVNKEIPKAEALIGKETDDADLQSLDKDDSKQMKDQRKENSGGLMNSENDSETDSSFSESDEAEELQKPHMKVPLELDLSDLAAALLENNQKSRMNCVVERKRAEELVDSPAKTMQLPFGVNFTTDPKKAKITGERIAIFCESGAENDRRDEAEQMRPIFIPIQRAPIPFGPQPQQVPLTHMPQSMLPQSFMQQMPPPFQQIPMRPPVPQQIMQAPRPEQQVRIQVQRIPIREIRLQQEVPIQRFQQEMPIQRIQQIQQEIPIQRVQQEIPIQRLEIHREIPIHRVRVQEIPIERVTQQEIPIQRLPFPLMPQRNSNEMPQIQIHRIPLGVALERAGITAEELKNIQRIAEEQISEEFHRMGLDASSSSEESGTIENNSAEDSDSQSQSNEQPQQQQSPQSLLQSMEQQQQQEQQADSDAEQSSTSQQNDMQQPPQPQQTLHPPMPDAVDPQILQIGRAAFGRSLQTPVLIPVPMMQPQEMPQESAESETAHSVHPRSIRDAEKVFLKNDKRVKRCACDCNC